MRPEKVCILEGADEGADEGATRNRMIGCHESLVTLLGGSLVQPDWGFRLRLRLRLRLKLRLGLRSRSKLAYTYTSLCSGSVIQPAPLELVS